jgi:hypothetical protein
MASGFATALMPTPATTTAESSEAAAKAGFEKSAVRLSFI